MELQIREYRNDDKTYLKQIVLSVFGDRDLRDRAYFGEACITPTQTKTLVAVVAGNPVGFTSFYQNPLHYHPHDFRVSVVVAPKFQHKGIGHKLHEALLNALPYSIARIRTITLEQTSAELFFKTLNYKPLLRSFAPKLTVQAVDLSAYIHILTALEVSGYCFRTLAELDIAQRYELVELCMSAYADIHTYSPPIPSQEWASIFLGKDCIDKAFFVAIKDKSLVGFSSLQLGEHKGEMESMWDGVARSQRALEFPLRLALKLQEVEYAMKNGVCNLNWEVDSVDLVGMQLLEELPFTLPPAYQIWVREVYH